MFIDNCNQKVSNAGEMIGRTKRHWKLDILYPVGEELREQLTPNSGCSNLTSLSVSQTWHDFSVHTCHCNL